jgi:hypothetical protein
MDWIELEEELTRVGSLVAIRWSWMVEGAGGEWRVL